MSDNFKVHMHYEGDRSNLAQLTCVFKFKEKEYRVMYYKMSYFAELFDVPDAVREHILTWAKMLNNPD